MSLPSQIGHKAMRANGRDAAGDPAVSGALLQLLERLESVLDDERECLRLSSFDALDRIIARKDQLSFEAGRYAHLATGPGRDPRLHAALDRTVRKLHDNAILLKRHTDAVGEITALISEIFKAESADGTYSSSVARREVR